MSYCKYPDELCINQTVFHKRVYCDAFPCLMKDEIPPMTNADYIRKLDDEELSDYLGGIYFDGFFDGANDEADWSDQYSVDWLRQPYKEVNNGMD